MFTGGFDPVNILAITPEISLLVLGLLVLALDLILPEERRGILGWVTAAGLVLTIGISLAVARPGTEATLLWGGMLRHDWLGFTFKIVFIFAAAITALFSMDLFEMGRRGEYYLLMLASTIGMNLMASAADLIMLYLAIETTSIPLYILAGFLTKDEKSTESGFKYFLFGALTSAVMLYGFSLLYGFAGTTNLYDLAAGLQSGGLSNALVLGSLMLVLIGFGFKVSAVPFHFWAPDVYEGAPTPIAGFLSTASKAAGFAVLARVLIVVFPNIALEWGAVVAALATATMTIGNLIALAQKNIKRLLAYSSIAHAGYALIGIVAISNLGVASTVFYLIAYVVTNLIVFGIVALFGKAAGSDDIAAYAGLSRRSPWLALVMLIAFLSLAGMPPFGGFVVKFAVFAAAVQAGMVWLAVIGVLNAIVGLYYYLTVLKVVYLYRSEDEDKPLPVSRPYAIGLTALSLLIILIGTVFAPWFSMASSAAAAIMR
ncbi:MAG TPA: NADH-quinone oxidoreductase subunit N [Anaerolineales bacterium]|nr:NADH-quinone oxidoreductase subunit N [Anaerolineales bacterium]